MNHRGPYLRLLLMAVLSFVAMYVLMYAMVDVFRNVHPSLNQFYMAGLMAAPMVAIELVVMGGMYPNKKRNAMLLVASIIVAVAFFVAIRKQTAIDDRELLKSMIPHHAGAILMCEEATLADPKIRELCRNIVTGQRAEIEAMERMLREGAR